MLFSQQIYNRVGSLQVIAFLSFNMINAGESSSEAVTSSQRSAEDSTDLVISSQRTLTPPIRMRLIRTDNLEDITNNITAGQEFSIVINSAVSSGNAGLMAVAGFSIGVP